MHIYQGHLGQFQLKVFWRTSYLTIFRFSYSIYA